MLRIGMLGAARVGVYAMLAPARALDGCEVRAVAARDPERARDYAAANGIPVVHPDYHALIDDPEIDLVYVATPPLNHAELALAAVAAGKPVLVEKPFAMDASEAAAVHDRAVAGGVPVFEAMHSPHHPLFARIKASVDGGEIGALARIDARFDAPISQQPGEFRWQAALGGGALMDLGVYPLAWCRRLAGEAFKVERATATIEGADTQFEAHLHFASGVEAVINSSLYGERHSAELILHGSKGRLIVDNYLAPQTGHRLTIEAADTPARDETVDGPTTYEAQLSAVRATLVDGAAFPFPPDDYVRSMAAIDSIRNAWSTA